MSVPARQTKNVDLMLDDPERLLDVSEAAALLKLADEKRKTEFEKWLPVTTSTDHEEATNFLDTELGKSFAARR